MHAYKTTALAVLVQALTGATATADILMESFTGARLDPARWCPRETASAAPGTSREPMRIAQADGMLRILGRNSGAGCLLLPTIDWNDCFVTQFQLSIDHSGFSKPVDHSTAGISFGFGEFQPESGFHDGFRLEVVSRAADVSLQLVLDEASKPTWSSSPVPIEPGFHMFEVHWRADPDSETLAISVYLDGDLSEPAVWYFGLPRSFAAREAMPMCCALHGWASAGASLTADFDEFDFQGDLRQPTESDDCGWSDADPHLDAPVFPPVDGAESLDSFQLALRLSSEQYALRGCDLIPLAISARGGLIRVTAREPHGLVRDMTFDALEGTLRSEEPRPATKSETAAWTLARAFDQALPLQTVVTASLLADPQAKWLDARLDAGTREWRIHEIDRYGTRQCRTMRSDGCTNGDGFTSTSFSRWLLGASSALSVSPDVVLLSSRMRRGGCEFVLMPWIGSPTLQVIEYDLMKNAILATRTRRATRAEVMASEDVESIRAGSRWLAAMRAMSDSRVVSLAFNYEQGGTLLRLTEQDEQGELRVTDF